MAYVWLLLGLVTLIVGGEVLVKGAVRIAMRFHLSTLVVGMTVVSFGTSAPELLVSLKANLVGHPDISIGNVVGSNIANIALVLGLTAVAFPILVDRNSIRLDWPMMMASTVLLWWFMMDGEISTIEGIIMIALLVFFTWFIIWKSRKENRRSDTTASEKVEEGRVPVLKDVGYVVVGCAAMAFGADWLVTGAVEVARSFGVSDLVVSVTIVAFGTSAPELITSMMAAIRKHSDISVGNLIGSNLFNILAILGITSVVKPIEVSDLVITQDMIWVSAVAVVILPMMITNRKISRVEGGILFLGYVAYVVYQIYR